MNVAIHGASSRHASPRPSTAPAGTTVAELKRMKELEAEHAKSKRMHAGSALKNAAIEDVASREL